MYDISRKICIGLKLRHMKKNYVNQERHAPIILTSEFRVKLAK